MNQPLGPHVGGGVGANPVTPTHERLASIDAGLFVCRSNSHPRAAESTQKTSQVVCGFRAVGRCDLAGRLGALGDGCAHGHV
jgi:hypothetical protein